MEYSRWAPLYRRIATDLDLPFAREEAAARTLRRALPPAARDDPLGRAADRLQGHEVVVVGLAPGAGPPPFWRRPAGTDPVALVAADGAAAVCVRAGLIPTVVVTDLDGPVPTEIAANARGALVVVHAHGDNVPALEEWVPQFPGPLAGSWAGPPDRELLDVGGFMDGDRGAYLAAAAGARRILLWGFDFERVDADDPLERARKRRKLGWAERALDALAADGAPVATWERDGRIVPYPGGSSGASTR